MFYFLRDGNPEIDGMMASVCDTGGGGKMVLPGWSLRPYSETGDVADMCVRTAKRQPKSLVHRQKKRQLYSVQYNRFRRLLDRDCDAVAVAWNGMTGTRLAWMEAARRTKTPRLILERAPFPGRVTVDAGGVNQRNTLPREASFYLDWLAAHSATGDGWRDLKPLLSARNARSGSNVGQTRADDALYAENFVFCPLQVPDDTQLRFFGGWVNGLDHFLEEVSRAARALPSGWHLRIKEHPSSKIRVTDQLSALSKAQPGKIIIDNQTDTFQQVDASKAVVTLNSSVGLQAFWYDKPVLVLGQAFFKIDGVSTAIDDSEALVSTFSNITDTTFDAQARNAFMSYLDQVYYPKVRTIGTRIDVDPSIVTKVIAKARALAQQPEELMV